MNTKTESKKQIDAEPQQIVVYGGVAVGTPTVSPTMTANRGVHINSSTQAVQLGDTDLTYAVNDILAVNSSGQWVNTNLGALGGLTHPQVLARTLGA